MTYLNACMVIADPDHTPVAHLNEDIPAIRFEDGGAYVSVQLSARMKPADQIEWLSKLGSAIDDLAEQIALASGIKTNVLSFEARP